MKIKRKIIDCLRNLLDAYKSLSSVCEEYPCLSFDIFDTLITRKCGSPENIFLLVERKYSDMYGSQLVGFKDMRVAAECEARNASNKEEVSLDDIYFYMEIKIGKEKSDRLKQIEVDTEIEECVGIDSNVCIYNRFAQDSTKKVFITSDMYLPKSVIIQILINNGIVMPKKLYVSCEEQFTKRKGTLFFKLIEENRINKHSLIHIGDNIKSDYLMARLAGIHSYLIG